MYPLVCAPSCTEAQCLQQPPSHPKAPTGHADAWPARASHMQARAEAVDRQRQLQEAGSRLRDCEASLQGEERKHAAHVAKLGQQLAEKEAVLAQRDEQVGR